MTAAVPTRITTRIPTLRRNGLLTATLCLLAAAAGLDVVADSFRQSTLGAAPGTYYALFWLGMVLAVVPVGAVLMSWSSTRPMRLGALALLGVVTAFPKYLRNPTAPLYHDEYAHFREATDVLTSGHLFRPNQIIPIVQYFPGTSALTAAVDRLSGLSVWSSGLLLVFAVHLTCLIAVYVIASVNLRSDHAGAVAALVYGINPSAVYFDTQYAYESVAVGLFLGTIAAGSLAAHSTTVPARRAWTTGAAACAAACVVTHHLTTLALLGALALISTVVALRNRRSAGAGTSPARAGENTRVWYVLLLVTLTIVVLWLSLVARPTVAYLRPYVGSSLGQLGHIAGNSGSGGRTVLAANVEPLWERIFTAFAPVATGVVAFDGLRRLRGRGASTRTTTLALVCFGLVYFPSVPFVLAPSGAEGARRSWAFTYLGIALIFAVVATGAAAKARLGVRDGYTARVIALSLGLLVYLLIGNVGASVNDPYRFPGPFSWGTDTRSYSPEARTVGFYLASLPGPVKIVTDQYTELAISGYAGVQVAQSSTGFPIWQLVEGAATPDAHLVGELTSSHYGYLVVDVRMFQQRAFNGLNYGYGDPDAAGPVPMKDLTYLESAPWAVPIYSTPHLRVYRLDFSGSTTSGSAASG